MNWVWTMVVLAALAGGYVIYSGGPGKPKAPASSELRETKAILLTKTKDHEALWIRYSYKDLQGKEHEMSERVPYSDLWEKLKIGQEIEIIYNDQGLSVLKAVASKTQ